MKPHRKKRLSLILFITTGFSLAIGLALYSLSQNIDLFFTPTQILAGEPVEGQRIRIGGMVKAGSLAKSESSLKVSFLTTDCSADVLVEYEGVLPDLFGEGQGVVADGTVVGVCFKPVEFWQSMMKIICRRKSELQWKLLAPIKPV